MKIQRKKGKIVIEIPDKTPRYNPYDETEDGEMDTLVGLISKYKGYEEYGLAWRIDMSYKDKSDQIGEYAILYPGSKEGFIKMCTDLKIDIATLN